MNILAISYHNIGPFVEKVVTISFKNGSYLIKAPIGTGKSFLFFDGPLFALYKSSSRPMLSRTQKSGRMHCCFEVEGSIWYIQRIITSTKAGNDSVQSRLFKVDRTYDEMMVMFDSYEIVTYDTDIHDHIQSYIQEVEFSSSRQLDDALQQLLPPKEVILAMNILMQDAINIFELPPGQRITVFKHLFGFLDIDEGKKRIADKRKEVQGMLRMLADDTVDVDTLRHMVSDIVRSKNDIERLIPAALHKLWGDIEALPLVRDSSLIVESITISGLEIDTEWQECTEAFIKHCDEYDREGAVLRDRIVHYNTQYVTLQKDYNNKKAQCKADMNNIEKLNRHLHEMKKDTSIKDNTQKKEVLDALQKLQTGLDFSAVQSLGEKWTMVSTLQDVVTVIHEYVDEGKQLSVLCERYDLQEEQLNKEGETINIRIQQLDKQLSEFSSKYEKQTTFTCDKIQGQCPYVEAIQGSVTRLLKQQIDSTYHEKKKQQDHYVTHKKLVVDSNILKKKNDANQRKDSIKSMLSRIGRKQRLQKKEDYDMLSKRLHDIDISMQRGEDLKKKYDELLNERNVLQARYETMQETLKEQEQKLLTLQKEKNELEVQIKDSGYDRIGNVKQCMKKIIYAYDRIDLMVQDHTKNAYKKERLLKQEKQLKELYQIFSKDLLVVVVQEFLPQLEDVINAYLAQVVGYQVHFYRPETIEDSLELEIEIKDHLGTRKVKSLSGGQKAILKIAWILAVSSLMRSAFLFMDETITSLDSDTVADVADMIDQFVTGRTTKLYVVTHAQQIQSMDIWDGVVEIS